LSYAGDIRALPQGTILLQQLEDFDFEAALETLMEIKERMAQG
jgi:hypothetical protein